MMAPPLAADPDLPPRHPVSAVWPRAGADLAYAPVRKQPIRDAIMSFLSEPRSARAIAAYIGRPVPTATGHLAAMSRRGLVRRLGYAAYARADYTGPPVDFRPSVPLLAHPMRDAIMRLLSEPRSAREIVAHTSPSMAHYHIKVLRDRGLIERLTPGVYARAGYVGPSPLRPDIREASADAGETGRAKSPLAPLLSASVRKPPR